MKNYASKDETHVYVQLINQLVLWVLIEKKAKLMK